MHSTHVGHVPVSIRFRGAVYHKVESYSLPATIRFRGAVYEIDASKLVEYMLAVKLDDDSMDDEVLSFNADVHNGIMRILRSPEINVFKGKVDIGTSKSGFTVYTFKLSVFNTKVLMNELTSFLSDKMHLLEGNVNLPQKENDEYYLFRSEDPYKRDPPTSLPVRPDLPENVDDRAEKLRKREQERKYLAPQAPEYPKEKLQQETVEDGMQKRRQHWTF